MVKLDTMTLKEREENYRIMYGEFGSLYGVPINEYIELRDKYIEATNEIKRLNQRLELSRERCEIFKDIAENKL